jgi:hypothetical protein
LASSEYRLTILAQSFQTQKLSATVHVSEHCVAPPITLSLAAHATRITVTPKTQEEIAEQQIKVQKTQRMLGFVPNFASATSPTRFL